MPFCALSTGRYEFGAQAPRSVSASGHSLSRVHMAPDACKPFPFGRFLLNLLPHYCTVAGTGAANQFGV